MTITPCRDSISARTRSRRRAEQEDRRTPWRGQLEEVFEDWLAFERLALMPEQIEENEVPIRASKLSSVRAARFTGRGSVEVEAMPVDVLLAIVEEAIVARIDAQALAAAELAEESEREVAHRIAATPVDRLVRAAA